VLEAVDVLRSAADAKHIAIETAVEGECRVLGDADRLRQSVWNLLSNAIKFTPAYGKARVTLECHDRHVRIVVADTGQGIRPEFLPFVFERFRQADTSSTRRHAGLGIGLAIVRELIELHGGRVAVDSAGEGHGATSTIELPLLVDEHHPIERAEAPAMEAAPLTDMRVLVVDDDPDSNEAVRTVLASAGADVRTASSADEALTVLGRWVPDVLVSDIAMPNEDGYALLARMRADVAGLGRIPAIALTALSAPSDRELALSAGFHAHVAKPPQTQELLRAVATAHHISEVRPELDRR